MATMTRATVKNSNFTYGLPPSSLWLFAVLGVQTLCQLGLLFEVLAPFRVVFRSGAFGINIAALILAQGPRKHPNHPAFWLGVLSIAWIAFQIMHPDTNTVLAAVASWALTLAVTAPLFWVPRLQITPKVIQTVIVCMWAFHTLSSIFGVLQVYYPGNFQPALSQVVKDSEMAQLSLKVTLAEGTEVFRPMGLTDSPGGASQAGLYAFVFGLGLFSLSRGPISSICGAISMPLGLFCIYLTQVRSSLVLTMIISVVYASALALTGRLSSAVRVSFTVPLVLIGAFIWAIAMGGETTLTRFESLIEENPDQIYYKNRGRFFETTIETDLPEYPFGAGLGRYGMMNSYFGDGSIEGSSSLWAEIQWSAWVYDGGVLLLIGYTLAIIIAIVATARVAFLTRYETLAGWALLILAYDIAIFALTFSYGVFLGQSGMEFWLLNAMIWTGAQQLPRRTGWQAG